MGRLSTIFVRNAKAGRHADGDGLYLFVRPTGSKQWVCRLVVANADGTKGKRRDFGLGSATLISLADARHMAIEYKELARKGIDPSIELRNREVERIANEAKMSVVFSDAAMRAYKELSPSWKNPKHRAQWINTIERYTFPYLGDKRVNEIEARDIIHALKVIWLEKPETARRVRQRIATVLDFSYGQGWRDRDAPMRAVSLALPKQPSRNNHFAAVPYLEASSVFSQLWDLEASMGRLALLYAILTAARSGEVRGAKWSEINLEQKIWTIPAERMKAGKEHIVPLTEKVIEILDKVKPLQQTSDSFLFPSTKLGPLSDMTLSASQKSVIEGFTVHGWRSTFRDWSSEITGFPSDVCEAALAHTISNKVEAAYRRGALLEKRRKLMDAWASYLEDRNMKVVDITDVREIKVRS